MPENRPSGKTKGTAGRYITAAGKQLTLTRDCAAPNPSGNGQQRLTAEVPVEPDGNKNPGQEITKAARVAAFIFSG